MEEEGERDIVTAFREYCFDKSEKRAKACAKRPGADATQGNEGIRRLIAGYYYSREINRLGVAGTTANTRKCAFIGR